MSTMDAFALHTLIDEAPPSSPGYWDDMPFTLATLKTSSDLTLTAATNPTITRSGNRSLITWAAGDTAAVSLSGWVLPRCHAMGSLDRTTRRDGGALRVQVDVLQTGTTDTPTLTATLYARTPGGAQKGPFTATATPTKGGTVPERLTLDFTCARDSGGNRIEPGDTIEELTIAPATHGTDSLIMTGMIIQHRRNVGYWSAAARRAVPG